MKQPMVTPVLMVVVLAFSGCAEDKTYTSVVDFGSDADETGSVRGFVTDDELQPVGGATVGFVGHPASNVTTDENGYFTILNAPVGQYLIHVILIGYSGEAKRMLVVAEETVKVSLQVVRLPVPEPSYEVATFVGKIPCGASVNAGGVYWVAARLPCDEGGFTAAAETTIRPTVKGLLDELVWTRSSVVSAPMLRLEAGSDEVCNEVGTLCDFEHVYFDDQGPSPVRAEITRFPGLDRDAVNEVTLVHHKVWTAVYDEPPFVLVVHDQMFTLYSTAFYGEPMPDGFSARADV